jgi:hypothetical protein
LYLTGHCICVAFSFRYRAAVRGDCTTLAWPSPTAVYYAVYSTVPTVLSGRTHHNNAPSPTRPRLRWFKRPASLTLLPVRMGTVVEARGLAVWPTQVQTGFVGQKFKIVASDPQQQAMGTGAPVWWATCAARNTEREHDVPRLGGWPDMKRRKERASGLLSYRLRGMESINQSYRFIRYHILACRR